MFAQANGARGKNDPVIQKARGKVILHAMFAAPRVCRVFVGIVASLCVVARCVSCHYCFAVCRGIIASLCVVALLPRCVSWQYCLAVCRGIIASLCVVALLPRCVSWHYCLAVCRGSMCSCNVLRQRIFKAGQSRVETLCVTIC
jgi:hypothetical protein